MSTCCCGIGEKAWTAGSSDNYQYLTIDLGEVKNITSIETQGRANYAQFVKEYTISYGTNNRDYVDYKEAGGNVKVIYCHGLWPSNRVDEFTKQNHLEKIEKKEERCDKNIVLTKEALIKLHSALFRLMKKKKKKKDDRGPLSYEIVCMWISTRRKLWITRALLSDVDWLRLSRFDCLLFCMKILVEIVSAHYFIHG